MRILNSVIQTFMSPKIGIGRGGLYITAKFVRHDDAGLTELLDKP